MSLERVRALAAVAAMVVALSPWAAATAATPAYVPSDPAEVLERVPPSRRRTPGRPANLEAAIRLAEENLALGRQTGDPRYDGRAEAALAAWEGKSDLPARVLELRALIAQRRHDFETALADLSVLLGRDPRNDQARLMRAAILQVQGKLAASRAACADLDERISLLIREACRVAAAPGDAPEATQALESAISRSARDSPDVRAWALGILAERRQLQGELAQAEEMLRMGLRQQPGDPFLLAALADLLLDQQRAEEVVAMLPADGRSLAISLRRARALVMLGRGEAERDALAAQFAVIRARGEVPHARSEAYYLLYVARDPAAALPRALDNFRVQREYADRKLLIDAAAAAGQRDRAAPARQWMAANGFE